MKNFRRFVTMHTALYTQSFGIAFLHEFPKFSDLKILETLTMLTTKEITFTPLYRPPNPRRLPKILKR